MAISVYVVSALAGNAWRESHINPTLQQLGGGAFGLFQWDGGRRDNLKAYLRDHGYSETDPYGQMEYLVIEDDWIGSYAGISSLTDFLNSDSQNIPELTTAFEKCWERAGVPALEERIDFANKAYQYITDNYDNPNINTWITEPMYYLSEAQALENSVLLYRYYSGGVVPPKPIDSRYIILGKRHGFYWRVMHGKI